MPGSLYQTEPVGALSEDVGLLGALHSNPLMAAQVLRMRALRQRPNVTDWGVPATAPSWSEAAARLSQNLSNSLPVPGYGLQGSTLQEMGPQVQAAAANLAQGIGPQQIVFHGSPHRFTQFDASKIGTGEGAQAYGHGTYLAESPAVAKQYQKTLSGEGYILTDGRKIMPGDELHPAVEQLWRDASPLVKQKTPAGNLYKADLPDSFIPKMLDWDKPLSQHSEAIQAALLPKVKEALAKRGTPKHLLEYHALRKTGEDIVKDIFVGNGVGRVEVSQMLSANGIPGIRYLDQGSRGAGQGTSNYVVFPGFEKEVKILERQ